MHSLQKYFVEKPWSSHTSKLYKMGGEPAVKLGHDSSSLGMRLLFESIAATLSAATVGIFLIKFFYALLQIPVIKPFNFYFKSSGDFDCR
jgi:hypothetical protein